ncbi:MAG: aspartate--tRNA ligase [Clostridia bacterium]|nr:aspartate--tRNA ligase [Clostridia bacterium]
MENIQGMKRTCRCAELTEAQIGQEVVVMGWVQKVRNLGALVFIDLRDRSGIVQLMIDDQNKELSEKASSVHMEFVLAVRGTVQKRGGAENTALKTGTIEILVSELRILNTSDVTPFVVEEDIKAKDELRLRYRYLDLRRKAMQEPMILRHKVCKIARDYFDENGFLEIETPILVKSTPEGARDYIVPSRMRAGGFYALPQSPQLYKQLLMVAGMDRYMQIARCFRDEDLRADRQPEFTQIDLEMSFVEEDDVMTVNEGFLKRVFKEALGLDIVTPFPRMTWREAMDRYGSDKPDTRFGYEIKNLSDLVGACGFSVFSGAVADGGSVRAICVKNTFGRKGIDALGEFVKTYRAKGLAWINLTEEGVKSPIAKFFSEEEIQAIIDRMEAQTGDIILIVADKDKVVFDSLGALRLEVAKKQDILDKQQFNFLWVTEFPQFEWSEEEGRFMAMHHPFTMPFDEDIDKLESDPGAVRAKAYDIVLNGVELGGGSLRIYDRELQQKMFRALGFSDEDAQERFDFLLEAFRYGTPPHGGMAYGLDRLIMLLSGRDSIRDVIAFPKVQNASELMSGAPGLVEQKQLDELHIALIPEEE